MIVSIIICALLLIRLVITITSKKCPHCKHRVFRKPFDIRFLKSNNGRVKISSYQCPKCKGIFEYEQSTF